MEAMCIDICCPLAISGITPGDSGLQGPKFSEKNDLATGYGLHLSASLYF